MTAVDRPIAEARKRIRERDDEIARMKLALAERMEARLAAALDAAAFAALLHDFGNADDSIAAWLRIRNYCLQALQEPSR